MGNFKCNRKFCTIFLPKAFVFHFHHVESLELSIFPQKSFITSTASSVNFTNILLVIYFTDLWAGTGPGCLLCGRQSRQLRGELHRGQVGHLQWRRSRGVLQLRRWSHQHQRPIR